MEGNWIWFPSWSRRSTPSTSLLVKSRQSCCKRIPQFVQSAGIRFKADVLTFGSKGREGKGVGSSQLLETLLISWIGGDPKGCRGSFASGASYPDIQCSLPLHLTGWSPAVPSQFAFWWYSQQHFHGILFKRSQIFKEICNFWDWFGNPRKLRTVRSARSSPPVSIRATCSAVHTPAPGVTKSHSNGF